MQITDVRVRKVTGDGKMLATATVTIEGEFVVHDIKVINGDNGLFIAMPSRRTKEGEFRDIAHPIRPETRQMLQDLILKAYNEAEDPEPEA